MMRQFAVLFGKECKQTLKSLVYYIFVIIFVLFLTSQMGDAEWTNSLEKPVQGAENYGTMYSDDPQAIMGHTLASLFTSYYYNSFATYPLGFYRNVQLSESKRQVIADVLQECTGRNVEELETAFVEHYTSVDQSSMEAMEAAYASYSVEPGAELTYEQFQNAMRRVCKIVGAGSGFEESRYENSAEVPMTYEDAMAEYEKLCYQDHVTGAYMRMFCDYAGIVLAILPIFLGVSRCLRDRRANAQQVIYARSSGSATVILSRYLSLIFMIYLPVAITALIIQLPYQYRAQTMGVTPDVFAFLSYTVVWLLPEIMIVTAVSFMLTELTENILAIFIQVAWGLGSLFHMTTLAGDFGFKLVVRWNTIGMTTQYLAERTQLYLNRGSYAVLSLLCVCLTIWIYQEKRRKGVILHGIGRKK